MVFITVKLDILGRVLKSIRIIAIKINDFRYGMKKLQSRRGTLNRLLTCILEIPPSINIGLVES